MTDPIADLLTRIRNAYLAQKEQTSVPHSKLKQSIAEKLLQLDYLSGVDVAGEGKDKTLLITLRYQGKTSVISGLKRVSKPGRRSYVSLKDIKPVLSGHGAAILSTNKGILSDKEAKQAQVGGEVICHIW